MSAKNKHKANPDTQTEAANLPQELVQGEPLEDYLPYQLFRIVNRLTLNLKNDLRPAKMTLARWRALSVLNAEDGRSMGELSAYMVIEQAALSRVVDQMERDGLVVRRHASDDNRVVRVYLTVTGRRMFTDIRPLELRHYAQLIEGLEPDRLQQLEESLQQLWQNIDHNGHGQL
jgi:DNA-binding MarR family transcriptional regulator